MIDLKANDVNLPCTGDTDAQHVVRVPAIEEFKEIKCYLEKIGVMKLTLLNNVSSMEERFPACKELENIFVTDRESFIKQFTLFRKFIATPSIIAKNKCSLLELDCYINSKYGEEILNEIMEATCSGEKAEMKDLEENKLMKDIR